MRLFRHQYSQVQAIAESDYAQLWDLRKQSQLRN